MLKLSQDRKVMGVPRERNSIGLPFLTTCPGATSVCKSVCYTQKGFMAFDTCKKMYQDNYDYIKWCLMFGGIDYCANQLAVEIKKYNKSGFFRWQISGDIFSRDYSAVIAEVAAKLPDIKFWVYTRSLDLFCVDWINKSNLQVIISFDRENITTRFGTFGFDVILPSYLGDIKEAKEFRPQTKWITCPQQLGKIDLAGACVKCKLCIKPPKNIGIHFIIKGEKKCQLLKQCPSIQELPILNQKMDIK
jgi:hypothetical protein